MEEEECSIPMCGIEAGEEPLVAVCPNGHFLHPTCIRQLLGSTFPQAMLCPLCRNGSLNRMVVTSIPTPVALSCTPFSAVAAVIAVRLGAKDLLK